jgi:DNA-binding transcriptional regulator YhcF (GntR family)
MNATSPRMPFDAIYRLVFDAIVGGHYRPGDRIAIKDLAERLRVSTTPLREALSRLAGRGVVEQRRSEGYYLARLDARDLSDLYALHHLCVARAAQFSWPHFEDHDMPNSAWDLFDMVVTGAGDAILTDVRRYLDDRLRLVRAIETLMLKNPRDEFDQLIHSVKLPDSDQFVQEIDRFHSSRSSIASALSLHLGRQSRSSQI